MQNNNSKFIQNLKLIHLALLVGQLFFIGITVMLKGENAYSNIFATSESFYFPVLILTALGILIGDFIYKLRCGVLDDSHSFEFKLNLYRSATIIKFALFEAPSLFAIVAFFTTGNFFYLAFSIFMIALTFFHKPTKEKMLEEVKWNKEEIAKIKRFK